MKTTPAVRRPVAPVATRAISSRIEEVIGYTALFGTEPVSAPARAVIEKYLARRFASFGVTLEDARGFEIERCYSGVPGCGFVEKYYSVFDPVRDCNWDFDLTGQL